jgi:hypothetical protein
MLVTALDGSSDTVDAVVRLLGRQTLESNLGGLALLFDKIVVSAVVSEVSILSGQAQGPIDRLRSPSEPIGACTGPPLAISSLGNARPNYRGRIRRWSSRGRVH